MNGTSIVAGLGSGAGLSWLWNTLLARPYGLAELPVDVAAIFIAAAVWLLNWAEDARDRRLAIKAQNHPAAIEPAPVDREDMTR